MDYRIDIIQLIETLLYEVKNPLDAASDDAIEAFFELYQTEMSNLIYEFLDNPSGKQSWKYLPLPRVKKIWSDYAKSGLVADEKGLDGIATIVIENIAKVYVNTILSGHTEIDPKYDVAEILSDRMDIAEFDWDSLYEYITDDVSGHMRISDYAMNDLISDAARILDANTDVDKLISIDRAFNRIHRRSDIAGWFLPGGARDLLELSSM